MTGLFRELRRRRVFRTAAYYIVGAWLVMQVADVLFPGWGLPDAAVNVLFVAAVIGFPLAWSSAGFSTSRRMASCVRPRCTKRTAMSR
jgi:hypothetical protein